MDFKTYYQKNKEKIKEYQKQRYLKNKNKIKNYNKEYFKNVRKKKLKLNTVILKIKPKIIDRIIVDFV